MGYNSKSDGFASDIRSLLTEKDMSLLGIQSAVCFVADGK